jgi:L-alanine-DL-glutamate epimerase-like enolase superfamily enzyme
MEFWYGANPLGAALQGTPFRIEDGYFHVPDGPGLGVDINEEQIRAWTA